MPDETLTVYYDGACPLCRAEIGYYRGRRSSERLRFVDVSVDAPEAGCGPALGRAAALRRFHVREADGALHSGAAAFARLWSALPGWAWLGWLVRRPRLAPMAEAAYRAFLPLRPHLARLLRRRRS